MDLILVIRVAVGYHPIVTFVIGIMKVTLMFLPFFDFQSKQFVSVAGGPITIASSHQNSGVRGVG